MTQQLSFDLDTAPSLTPKRSPEIGAHDRCVVHLGMSLPYRLHRSRRRSIGLTVGDDGLRVTAPSWVSLRHIDEAVIEKFDWVQRKLQAIHIRHRLFGEPNRKHWPHQAPKVGIGRQQLA